MQRLGTVVIIGVGLIGGSIGRALRDRQAAGRVIGVDQDATRLRLAEELGAIDTGTTNVESAVDAAEVVVVCTPVTATVPLVLAASERAPGSALITDVGSTKARIVREVEAHPSARGSFIGSHPIAGSERQGVEHARPDLFAGKTCALTPTERTPPDRLDRARRFWLGLDARPIVIDPTQHDFRMALTSHLPHAVASALASSVAPEYFPLAAGAYRDGTRVAGAEAQLWAGIFLDNREPILAALNAFEREVQAFRAALDASDRDRIVAWWENGRRRRVPFVEGQTGSG